MGKRFKKENPILKRRKLQYACITQHEDMLLQDFARRVHNIYNESGRQSLDQFCTQRGTQNQKVGSVTYGT